MSQDDLEQEVLNEMKNKEIKPVQYEEVPNQEESSGQEMQMVN